MNKEERITAKVKDICKSLLRQNYYENSKDEVDDVLKAYGTYEKAFKYMFIQYKAAMVLLDEMDDNCGAPK